MSLMNFVSLLGGFLGGTLVFNTIVILIRRFEERRELLRMKEYIRDTSQQYAEAVDLCDEFADRGILSGVVFRYEYATGDPQQLLYDVIKQNRDTFLGYLDKCMEYKAGRRKLYTELRELKENNQRYYDPDEHQLLCKMITELGQKFGDVPEFEAVVGKGRKAKKFKMSYKDVRRMLM